MDFRLNDIVENFGVIAYVIGFHGITNDLILENQRIGKWIADPAKCNLIETADGVLKKYQR